MEPFLIYEQNKKYNNFEMLSHTILKFFGFFKKKYRNCNKEINR